MKKIELTAIDMARRFTGIKEIPGDGNNSLIVAMLQLDAPWFDQDSTAWCSSFVNFVCWLLDLPRSKSPAARSWLLVGHEVKHRHESLIGFDVVILKRGTEPQPDETEINAPGHVGFFAGFVNDKVQLLGGNQSNTVSVASYPIDKILGIRRLFE